MKKLILFLMMMVSFSFAIEFDFKKTALDKFELQGKTSKIVYKNKAHRDLQIGKLWDEFLSLKEFDLKKSLDKKIYVVYSNYKANSFDCFIGIKSDTKINEFTHKVVSKSKYQNTILEYKKGMNISDIWDEMQKQKLDRDFKVDIEQYDLMDLKKDSYFINIYLSMKKD